MECDDSQEVGRMVRPIQPKRKKFNSTQFLIFYDGDKIPSQNFLNAYTAMMVFYLESNHILSAPSTTPAP